MKGHSYLKWYLILALAIGGIGIIDGSLNLLTVCPCSYQNIIGFVSISFFFFNFFILGIFLYNRLPAATLILPSYHIIFYVLVTAVGLYFALQGTFTTMLITIFNLISITGSLFETGLSVYLLHRFRFIRVRI